MRWFNELRGDGMIECEDGESYQVLAADFVASPPVGRCAGLEVTFSAGEAGRAVDVALRSEEDVPRRARLRSHRVARGSS
ncbi:MAG: hypothetical protein ABIR67_01910 [Gaiellaceae bacterium]